MGLEKSHSHFLEQMPFPLVNSNASIPSPRFVFPAFDLYSPGWNFGHISLVYDRQASFHWEVRLVFIAFLLVLGSDPFSLSGGSGLWLLISHSSFLVWKPSLSFLTQPVCSSTRDSLPFSCSLRSCCASYPTSIY